MRITILLAASVAASLCSSHAAQAQDFTGPRVELNAGYDTTRHDDGVAATPNSIDGLRIGGALGYDVAIGKNFTIGAEAGLGFNVSGGIDEQLGANKVRLTSGRDIDLSLRLGAIVAPRTLLFLKAGYANSEYRVRTTTPANSVSKASDDNDGYRLGAGVEHMLNDHVYAKAEYRYTAYGDDVSRHQVLAGVGYRF